MIKNLFTPTSTAVTILGIVFLLITKKSWNEVIKKAAIKIKHKLISFKSSGLEQQRIRKTNKKIEGDSRKLKSLYQKLGVKNFNEFDELFIKLIKESLANKNKLKQQENKIGSIFALWKFYMFSYLNLYLVSNSKFALLWLYNNPGKTREMLQINISLPPNISSPTLEKEAIFNALIAHNLIFKDSRGLYLVSSIGKDFLVFIGLIRYK